MSAGVVVPDKDGNISAESYLGLLPAGYLFVSKPETLNVKEFEEMKGFGSATVDKFQKKIAIRRMSESEMEAAQNLIDETQPLFVTYEYGQFVSFDSWAKEAKNGVISADVLSAAIQKKTEGASFVVKQDLKKDDLYAIGYHDGVKMVILASGAKVQSEANFEVMYRLYNKNTGEHFYTADDFEKNTLIDYGWQYEGEAWKAPVTSDTPVFRLYNKNAGDHHYTPDKEEKDTLVKLGWEDEGIGWYSAGETGIPLLRLYNKNAIAGAHHYTVSEEERDGLVKLGWIDEGIGWYGLR